MRRLVSLVIVLAAILLLGLPAACGAAAQTAAETGTPLVGTTPAPSATRLPPTERPTTPTHTPTPTSTPLPTATLSPWSGLTLASADYPLVLTNTTEIRKWTELYGSRTVLEADTRWEFQLSVEALGPAAQTASAGIQLRGLAAAGEVERLLLYYRSGHWSLRYFSATANNGGSVVEEFTALTDADQHFNLLLANRGQDFELSTPQGFEYRHSGIVFSTADFVASSVEVDPQTRLFIRGLAIERLSAAAPAEPTAALAAPSAEPGAALRGEAQYVFHVGVNGRDTNPGTEALPFATLAHARDVIRPLLPGMRASILVYIHGGTYPLAQPLQFGPADSGQNGFDVVYRAAPGEAPLLSGGVAVRGWEPVPGSPMWKASLSAATGFRQLYVNGVRAGRAASPSAVTGSDWATGETGDRDGIRLAGDRLPRLARPQDLELHWIFDWKDMRLPVQSQTISGTDQILWMRQPYFSFAQSMQHKGYDWYPRYDKPFYLENALELLDTPGEWYYNSTARELFYWPRDGEDLPTADIVIPQTQTLLELTGQQIGDEVHNLVFEGLTFVFAGWNAASEVGTFGGQAQQLITNPAQGNYGQTMTPAHVQLQAARDIRFVANRFQHLGAVGISLGNNTARITLQGNLFQDISDAAIVVGSWEHAYITSPAFQAAPRDNLIADNLIRSVGVEYWGAPAITAYYVLDLRIIHNEISQVPYTGISLGWGWAGTPDSVTSGGSLISLNLITDVLLRARDGGGIYTLGQQPGTVIEKNVIRRANNNFACLYPDEGSAYILFQENVCDTAPKWVNIWIDTIHDLRVLNNYTNVRAMLNAGRDITLSGTTLVEGQAWPPDAHRLMGLAGLEPAFEYLRDWVQ